MSSKKPTPPTVNEKTLTAEGICLIIRSCGENRVAELHFGDLYLNFGTPTETSPLARSLAESAGNVDTNPPSAATEIAGTQQQIAKESLVQDELRVRAEQLALMLIEDPERGEQLLMDEGLDPNGAGPEDDEDE